MQVLQLALSFHAGMWFGVLVDERDRLVASDFSDGRRNVEEHLRWLAKRSSARILQTPRHRYVQEMIKLFMGKQPSKQTPLALQTASVFQGRVYSVLNMIPRGRVTSYGLIARAIDSGPRAVGQAVGSNPCPLFVPCHRVVPSDMTVGNYSMSDGAEHGSDVKKMLLEREGIRLKDERIHSSSLWVP